MTWHSSNGIVNDVVLDDKALETLRAANHGLCHPHSLENKQNFTIETIDLNVITYRRDLVSFWEAEVFLAEIVLLPGPVAPDPVGKECLAAVLSPRGVPAALVRLAEDGAADPGSHGGLVLEPTALTGQRDPGQLLGPLPATIRRKLIDSGLLATANLREISDEVCEFSAFVLDCCYNAAGERSLRPKLHQKKEQRQESKVLSENTSVIYTSSDLSCNCVSENFAVYLNLLLNLYVRT